MRKLVKRLLLFDLDGTLILSGGAGSRAMDRAFEELFGVQNAARHVIPDGKTDLQILREIYWKTLGVDADPHLPALREAYLRYLAEEVPKSPGYRVLPGVRKTLHELARREDVVLGLATGNLEEGARIKLSRTDLWPLFAGGGFGSDAEDRVQILWAAYWKLRDRGPFAEVWIVGDTPRDIWAARRAGYRVAVVPTGHFSLEELEVWAPDAAGSRLDEVVARILEGRAELTSLVEPAS